MIGLPVEFVEDPEMISWCPLGAVILGGQKMHSLDLRREEDQQRFGEVLVENEVACPRCFLPHHCQLESIVFARVVARIRCRECGFRFRWYASETHWLVYERYGPREDVAAGQIPKRAARKLAKAMTAGRIGKPTPRKLAKAMWQGLLNSEFDQPEERIEFGESVEAPSIILRDRIGDFRCPICREALLHPIRYRTGLVRVVCRNAGCRQQWGFNPGQPLEEKNTAALAEAV